MGGKFEFDDTRDAIGVNSLEHGERKQMLNKFLDAGGQVLSDKELKEKKREEVRRREAQEARSRKSKANVQESGKKQPSQAAMAAKLAEKREKQLKGGTAKLGIRLKALFAGLAPFSGSVAKPSFFKFLGLEVKQAVVEFNLLGNDLFLQNKAAGKSIAKELDAKNPMVMEAMERLHALYDASEFHALMEYHQVSPDIDIPFSSFETPLKSIYRKLYYLYPYQETLKKGFVTAIDLYKKNSGASAVESNVWEQKKKKFLKDVKIVFEQAFPKLFLLICRIDGINYPPFSSYFEKEFGIDQDLKLGSRKSGESTALASSISEHDETDVENASEDSQSGEGAEGEDVGEEDSKSEESAIRQTKEYKYGMSLMNALDPEGLRKKHDPENHYHDAKLNDRAFLAFLFFSEFDRELSFVLTTKKIKLSVDYSGGKKDYKQILADIFNDSRNIIQAFDKYYKSRVEFNEVESNDGLSYVEASKRKEKLKTNVDMEGRVVRGSINSYISKVSKNLALLVSDMKGQQKIVENMDDPINFESDLEGAKRLNGQAVKQCILEAYCYSLALSERLDNGDLYGGILDMTDEEMKSSFGKKLMSGLSE